MRRSTIRSFAAASFFIPLVATCTAPERVQALAREHGQAVSMTN